MIRFENVGKDFRKHRVLDDVAPLVNRVVEMDTGRIVLADRVAEDSQLSALFQVHLTLARADAAIACASWELSRATPGCCQVSR